MVRFILAADMHKGTVTPFCAQVGGHGDLARVGLVQGMPPPAPPAQLYDWDLATAALAAAHAVSRELKAAAFPPPPSFQPAPQPPLPGERPALLSWATADAPHISTVFIPWQCAEMQAFLWTLGPGSGEAVLLTRQGCNDRPNLVYGGIFKRQDIDRFSIIIAGKLK